jgi:hypothetical protein
LNASCTCAVRKDNARYTWVSVFISLNEIDSIDGTVSWVFIPKGLQYIINIKSSHLTVAIHCLTVSNLSRNRLGLVGLNTCWWSSSTTQVVNGHLYLTLLSSLIYVNRNLLMLLLFLYQASLYFWWLKSKKDER